VIDVRTKHTHDDVTQSPIVAARQRYGGLDLPAALAGMLAGLGLTVLLAGIAAAAGTISYSNGASTDELFNGGMITGLAVLLVGFFVGGWVAGRMSRYDGALNGLASAALFLLLMAGMSGVGRWLDASYDFFSDVRLPQWFTSAETNAALVSMAVGAVLVLLAAALGGRWGTRFHRKADALIVSGDGMAYLERSSSDAAAEDYDGRHEGRHAIR
jgi:hypothetical protein